LNDEHCEYTYAAICQKDLNNIIKTTPMTLTTSVFQTSTFPPTSSGLFSTTSKLNFSTGIIESSPTTLFLGY
jgi:hypothetical protein